MIKTATFERFIDSYTIITISKFTLFARKSSHNMIKVIHKIFFRLQKKEFQRLRKVKFQEFNRHVSVGDLLFSRTDTAEFLEFGEGTTCYNNVLVIGEVKVGKNTWIGPNVILDGSGGLTIGDNVSISAGVQIYSHQNIGQTVTFGIEEIKRNSTFIGSGVYIGPNAVIEMGVTIGDGSVIGALSLVRNNVPSNSKAFGIPAIVINTPDKSKDVT